MEKALRQTLIGGRFSCVPPSRSRVMGSIPSKGNRSTEQRFRLALVRAGVSGWVLNNEKLPGKPDFYFKRRKVAVFVDGCFWHGCPDCGHIPHTNEEFWRTKIRRTKERDGAAARALRQLGITTVRFWEHDIQKHLGSCVAALNMKMREFA